MQWERDPPWLALQWLDDKVVSVITTIDNANIKARVTRKQQLLLARGLLLKFHSLELLLTT